MPPTSTANNKYLDLKIPPSYSGMVTCIPNSSVQLLHLTLQETTLVIIVLVFDQTLMLLLWTDI